MAKTTDNDQRIRDLKDAIQKQIDEIPKIDKNFKTNLSLTFHDKFYNLNVVTENDLKELLIQLHLYDSAISALDIKDFVISSYAVADWIDDVKKMIDIKHYYTRLAELRRSFNKIDSMLSDTAKTEDYLNGLEKFLKGE